jgi:hypothetical protein
MLSAVFRTRHQRLLASLISDSYFWDRFQEVWVAYGEAMLVERTLHDPGSVYGPAEYDVVLRRSQPLEIPAAAILALSDRWDMSAAIADIVGHLTKATQLFDDFVDAPEDLRAGNYTWMVRRLGGLDGPEDLKRGMIAQFDQVISEAEKELDVAVGIGEAIGITDMTGWANARKEAMNRIVEVTYQALFGILARDD